MESFQFLKEKARTDIGTYEELKPQNQTDIAKRLKKAITENASLETVEPLIKLLRDKNQRIGRSKSAPLHWAALTNNKVAIKVLLENGANINAKNKHGFTPLHHALDQNKFDSAYYLICKGADLNIQNGNGLTPRELSAEKGA